MNRYDIALDIACNHNEELKQNCLSQADKIIKENEVIVLFTTDIHAQTEKLHIVKERLMELELEGRNVLLVDSGDINEKTRDITKQMNGYYDVVTAGNHDCSCTGKVFMDRVKEADFTYIAYDLVKDGEPVLDPYRIYEFPSMKIGFIGQSYLNTTSGKWDGAKAKRDPLVLQEWVDKIRNDVDYVILLLHNGEDAAKTILKKVSGIDIILGGHTHKIVAKTLTDMDGRNVCYAQAGVRLNCYGEMTISDTVTVEMKGMG